jgi:uncharacterized protein YqjF (DUF2071 family)
MAGNRPEERIACSLIRQSWRDVTFLHWRVAPEVVAALLPEQLTPDIVDGSAWLSLTPFRVERFRLLGVPYSRFDWSFPETNVRTYVRGPDGRDGLWFLSLDVPSAPNVLGGRLLSLPYFPSSMTVTRGDTVRYQSRRRSAPPAHHDIEVRPAGPITGDDHIAALLAGRWRAFTKIGTRLAIIPVEHQPWHLQAADVIRLDQALLPAGLLHVTTGEPLAYYARGVDARFGPPRIVRAVPAPSPERAGPRLV